MFWAGWVRTQHDVLNILVGLGLSLCYPPPNRKKPPPVHSLVGPPNDLVGMWGGRFLADFHRLPAEILRHFFFFFFSFLSFFFFLFCPVRFPYIGKRPTGPEYLESPVKSEFAHDEIWLFRFWLLVCNLSTLARFLVCPMGCPGYQGSAIAYWGAFRFSEVMSRWGVNSVRRRPSRPKQDLFTAGEKHRCLRARRRPPLLRFLEAFAVQVPARF